MQKFLGRMMLVAVAGALPSLGCQSCQKPCLTPVAPSPGYGGTAYLVPSVDRSIPAGPVVAQQGAIQYPAMAQQPVVQNPVAQGPAVAQIRGYAPPLAVPAQPSWGPAANAGPSVGARLLAPEIATNEPPIAAKPRVQETRPEENKKLPDGPPQASATPPMPVDIAGFSPVKDQVSAGQRPLPGGYDWLKQNGYRTVLFIHEAGDDDAADKRLADEHGLKYLHLELPPKTIGQRLVSDFNDIVGDAAYRPLFVYDRNGSLAGGLWYLHFRIVDKMADEAARTKAAGFGLKTQKDNLNDPMWLAVQKYLSENPL